MVIRLPLENAAGLSAFYLLIWLLTETDSGSWEQKEHLPNFGRMVQEGIGNYRVKPFSSKEHSAQKNNRLLLFFLPSIGNILCHLSLESIANLLSKVYKILNFHIFLRNLFFLIGEKLIKNTNSPSTKIDVNTICWSLCF